MSITELLLGRALPTDLLPQTQALLAEWTRQRLGQQPTDQDPVALAPTFPFQSLPPSPRLRFELVDWQNFALYLPLFAAEDSPFVDAQFRSRLALEAYAVALLTNMRYSWKRAGCDWLLRRADDQPVGVLHLYDLSHEVIGARVPHCSVGYAIAAPFQRQGLAREALTHLLHHAAALFGRTEARALTDAGNLASQRLLRSCGFEVLEDRPATAYRKAEQLWQRFLI